MKLKHHRFRFGMIGNLKVLLCRIFGHRVSDDPTGFACQRCRLAYEEIYSPGYWEEMFEWFGSDDPDDDVYGDSSPILDLLRQLADLQNGPPLETYREEWEKTMSAVYEFLHEHEPRPNG